MTKQILQVMNLIGIVTNLYLLGINHYYGIGGYGIHFVGCGFFLASMLLIKLSSVI